MNHFLLKLLVFWFHFNFFYLLVYHQGDDSISCHLIVTGAVGIWIKSADTSDLLAPTDNSKHSGVDDGLSGLILGECVSALRAGGQKQSFGMFALFYSV